MKKFISLFFVFLLLAGEYFYICPAYAAFDVKGVPLFKDNNICIIMAGSTTQQGLSLSDIQSNQESVQSKVSSSGSLCPVPPFFTGGAILTTASGMTTQAQPAVQGLGRGILISEIAGDSGGVSSSGDPTGFSSLISRLGGVATSIFEILLPSGCDVIDDDDDIVGASTDLTTINDFSFITCASTNGITVQCNSASNLLTAGNGLVAASGSSPAKIRFVISAFETVADNTKIDSILIRLDSQDIFCPHSIGSPLTATIIAKNKVGSPTVSETLGTTDLGNPSQAAKIGYLTDTATSQKGETSTNEVGTTPLLVNGGNTTANKIQIEELHNEGIPLGGQSSAILINPSGTSTAENNVINILIVPTITNLFATAPLASDVTFSDNSLIVHSAPYIVMSNSDDLNAPFGTLVIPIRKNDASTTTSPATVKTIISINNLVLSSATSSSQDSIVSLAFFEPISGAIVNIPAGLSINNSSHPTNSQNFSAFSIGSARALAQNAVVGGAVNDPTGANQITSDADLSALASRNTTLGAPQITIFTKIISMLTSPDTEKISVSNSNSILTVTGSADAAISGAKVKIDSVAKGAMSAFDSVTITSKSDGGFTAKLKADFSGGDVTVNLKQTVSSQESEQASKTISQVVSGTGGILPCEQTVCGCTNTDCIPTIVLVLSYVENNGGLASVVTEGGAKLDELIKSAKKALGLS